MCMALGEGVVVQNIRTAPATLATGERVWLMTMGYYGMV